MIEALKKTLLAGVGAALITRDKVEASLEDLVRQGKLSADDARAAAEKIASQGRREFDSATTQLHDKVRDLLDYSDRKAQARLDALEERLRSLERQQAGAGADAARAPRAHRAAKPATRTGKS